jgi:hypothetical protein
MMACVLVNHKQYEINLTELALRSEAIGIVSVSLYGLRPLVTS